MKLISDISFSGFLDMQKNKVSDILPKIYFFDKKKSTEITTS
jgi:hypothetical protein